MGGTVATHADVGGKTYKEIADLLGISRTLVMALEKRALAKLGLAMGDDTLWRSLPMWIKKFGTPGVRLRVHTGKYHCGKCGKQGHSARTCGREPRTRGPRLRPGTDVVG